MICKACFRRSLFVQYVPRLPPPPPLKARPARTNLEQRTGYPKDTGQGVSVFPPATGISVQATQAPLRPPPPEGPPGLRIVQTSWV